MIATSMISIVIAGVVVSAMKDSRDVFRLFLA